MASKERFQNPVADDTVILRQFVYNSNNFADVSSVDSVDIYVLDRESVSGDNPEGRVLVESLDASAVVHDSVGNYHVAVDLSDSRYVIGHYYDVWGVTVDVAKPRQTLEGVFQVYSDNWYASPLPVVYDFSFFFQPNRMRRGSRQYLRVEVVPNVPRASDLSRYYENIAIAADLTASMQIKCAPCVPVESDLRMVFEDTPVPFREKCTGYLQVDTVDMECGIYDVWFKLALGGNLYLSERMAFQIYD